MIFHMSSQKPKTISWPFIIIIHIFLGPIVLFMVACMAAAFPDPIEGILGLIGMTILIVPVMVTLIFSFIPFVIMGVISGIMIKRSVVFYQAAIISGCVGAFSGYIWPKVFENAPPGESTLMLIIPGIIAAFFCNFVCYRRQVKRRGIN